MGRGRSGLKSGGRRNNNVNTPSGITYDQFMAMSDEQKYQTMDDIIDNSNIVVPEYLDKSATTKVMYALGMNNKPTVVSDAEIESLPGEDLYRTVYESDSMPPPSSADILDQIRHGDYTQMSGAGGSVHGRAIYFAESFESSADYGWEEKNPLMMRAKINSGANIADEDDLYRRMRNDSKYTSSKAYATHSDNVALYALSQGIDGWHDPFDGYAMIINRGILTASSQNKSIKKSASDYDYASSWAEAMNA